MTAKETKTVVQLPRWLVGLLLFICIAGPIATLAGFIVYDSLLEQLDQNSCEDRSAARTDLRSTLSSIRTRVESNPETVVVIDALLDNLPPIKC